MKRPTSVTLSARMRCGYPRLSQSQTTSTGGWQVELIPTTGSTNTERPTSQYVSRESAPLSLSSILSLVVGARMASGTYRSGCVSAVTWYPSSSARPQFACLALLNIGPTTAHDVQLTQNHSTFYPALTCCSHLSVACPRKGPVSRRSRTPSSSSCRIAHSWAAKSQAIIPDSTLRGPASASLSLSGHDAARQSLECFIAAWRRTAIPREGHSKRGYLERPSAAKLRQVN